MYNLFNEVNMKVFLAGVVLVVLMLAASWLVVGNQILLTKYLGVESENAKREVFEETKSYNEGKTQQLAKYWQEYKTAASDEDKAALKATIQTMFADYDVDKLPLPLKNFLTEMRGY